VLFRVAFAAVDKRFNSNARGNAGATSCAQYKAPPPRNRARGGHEVRLPRGGARQSVCRESVSDFITGVQYSGEQLRHDFAARRSCFKCNCLRRPMLGPSFARCSSASRVQDRGDCRRRPPTQHARDQRLASTSMAPAAIACPARLVPRYPFIGAIRTFVAHEFHAQAAHQCDVQAGVLPSTGQRRCTRQRGDTFNTELRPQLNV
jgi:hypothetical protein